MPFLDANSVSLHLAGAAAGQTLIEPSKGIDVSGFGGIAFLVVMGDIDASAEVTISAQCSEDDGDADTYDDIKGSAVVVSDATDDSIYVLDVARPVKRWVRCIVTRATQDSAVTAIIAVRYDPAKQPVTQSADISAGSALADVDLGTP